MDNFHFNLANFVDKHQNFPSLTMVVVKFDFVRRSGFECLY